MGTDRVGFTKPTTFAGLSDALDALRAGLALLPLDADQAVGSPAGSTPGPLGSSPTGCTTSARWGAVAFVGLDPHPIHLRRATAPE
ncbi:hypothetical protein ACFU7Y_24280 [Kitasatospora sp. NPDC057542]|uniref:hypothetical protein n=1 Tax=Kitasatospora sp. NPDC057542 TaxID=3346162 RepID=UPI0036A04318